MKALIALFAFSFSVHATSCEVELFNKIFIASNSKINNWKSLIKKSTCDEKTDFAVTGFITKAQGHVITSVVKSELALDEVTISPRKVFVSPLTSFLETEGRLPKSFHAENFTFTDGDQYLTLGELDSLKINCERCDQLGEANLKLQVERQGSVHGKWAKALIVQKVLAFFPRAHININQKFLTKDDFTTKFISTKSPSELFQDIDQVQYFTTVRALNPEKPLKQSDLFAMNLVTPQTLVDVVLKEGKLTLSTKGYPIKNARYGESVNIRNANSNRLITAKVIGRNKAVVE